MSAPTRAGVDVVVPFKGTRANREVVLSRIGALDRDRADTITLVDNTSGASPRGEADGVRVVTAARRRSSYYARNCGARPGTGEWLLFLDADVEPPIDLIDRYLATPIDDGVGIVAGGIRDEVDGRGLVSRYVGLRQSLSDANTRRGRWAYAQTANVLVRRKTYDELGGFVEDVRSGGDADLCFRAVAAGWRLTWNDRAVVTHQNRETLTDLTRQYARYGAGAQWLGTRHPGFAPPQAVLPIVRDLLRGLVVAPRHALRGDGATALRRVLDPYTGLAFELGRRGSNNVADLTDVAR